MPATKTSARPEVLLVDGEPVAGFELPRHVVPPSFGAHRVLASDGPSLRRALGRLPFAAIIDGRSDTSSLSRTLAEIRLHPGGEQLPVIVVAGDQAAADAVSRALGVEVISVPIDLPTIHARLLELNDAAAVTSGVQPRQQL